MATKKWYRVTGAPDVGFIHDGAPVMGGDKVEMSDEEAAYRLKLGTIEGPLDDDGEPPESEEEVEETETKPAPRGGKGKTRGR